MPRLTLILPHPSKIRQPSVCEILHPRASGVKPLAQLFRASEPQCFVRLLSSHHQQIDLWDCFIPRLHHGDGPVAVKRADVRLERPGIRAAGTQSVCRGADSRQLEAKVTYRVDDALGADGKDSISFGQAGRIGHAANTLVAATLSQRESRCRGVRDNVAPNGLLGIRRECGCSVHLRHDLVRDDHRHAELVRQTHQASQELGEVHLSRREFASTGKVGAVERRKRVNDEQREARFGHHRRRLHEQLQLVVGVVGTRIRHVVEHLFAVEPVTLGDSEQTSGTEGTFRVDVQALALASAHVDRKLAGDCQCMAELTLARPELAVKLGDAACLHATAEDGIEVLGSRRDRDELVPARVELGSRGEAHRHQLGSCKGHEHAGGEKRQGEGGYISRLTRCEKALMSMSDALDEEEVLLGRESDALDSVVSGFGELLAVGARDAKAKHGEGHSSGYAPLAWIRARGRNPRPCPPRRVARGPGRSETCSVCEVDTEEGGDARWIERASLPGRKEARPFDKALLWQRRASGGRMRRRRAGVMVRAASWEQ
ncbi:hypothetical protein L1887_51509 [Cichorium endivia]|nr:hypothetical protein L1887_51509 [Cichorium endivia]